MSDELDDAAFAAERDRLARYWFHFSATVRVRAEDEADARSAIENSVIELDDEPDGYFWGPFVAVHDLTGRTDI